MLKHIGRRLLLFIPMILFVSVVSFIIMQLPPGNVFTNKLATMRMEGASAKELAATLEKAYGLDKPIVVQYFRWAGNLLRGDLGYSFMYNRPVRELIGERIVLTTVISLLTMVFTWLMSFPIAFYASRHQYSAGDYVASTVGFLGLAIPNFLLALVLMYLAYVVFGADVTGLVSSRFQTQPWNLAKILDMASRLWLPLVVIGTAGTAGLIRILRGCLLDELNKPYVVTARAKGMQERRLLWKYPVRAAINPLVSTIGWALPAIISGEAIVSIVLGYQTVGPLLLNALLNQDMYLGGAILVLLSFLTIVGTLVSDILLVVLDPRLRG
jgi:peptide/nickel transport system permease protein